MPMVAIAKPETDLRLMIDKMGKDLDKAKVPAEFLESISKLSVYKDINKARLNAAKREQTRNPKFKEAYDDIIKTCYQCEQDIIFMRRRAEILLSEEYDSGVKEGRYSPQNRPSEKPKGSAAPTVSEKPKTQNELGIKKQNMSQYRRSATVEKNFPGVVEATIREATAKGDEPTITKVHKVEKDLFQQAKENVHSNRQEAKQKRQEEKAAHDKKIDDMDLPPIWAERFKSNAKPEITQFVREFCSRLRKEKMKLEEIMHHADKINRFERRIELPDVLGEVGDFFLECAKLLKNQEILPDLEKLTIINPEQTS